MKNNFTERRFCEMSRFNRLAPGFKCSHRFVQDGGMTLKFKKAYFRSLFEVDIKDEEMESPKDDEVIVRVKACAICASEKVPTTCSVKCREHYRISSQTWT